MCEERLGRWNLNAWQVNLKIWEAQRCVNFAFARAFLIEVCDSCFAETNAVCKKRRKDGLRNYSHL